MGLHVPLREGISDISAVFRRCDSYFPGRVDKASLNALLDA